MVSGAVSLCEVAYCVPSGTPWVFLSPQLAYLEGEVILVFIERTDESEAGWAKELGSPWIAVSLLCAANGIPLPCKPKVEKAKGLISPENIKAFTFKLTVELLMSWRLSSAVTRTSQPGTLMPLWGWDCSVTWWQPLGDHIRLSRV